MPFVYVHKYGLTIVNMMYMTFLLKQQLENVRSYKALLFFVETQFGVYIKIMSNNGSFMCQYFSTKQQS